ncbi:SoxR reducing system RseC family protein [Vibrio tapetis]|uniref:Putative Positive regulator of sigma(E),RseC/MucC n=1 Tax=Vibrio tapetis subsp. tapetis TaxID=1671868 RepID=A0A2N8Z833_9VIBR|nr:SoxR reducing system RseC family protein [Vibrio tapetis]SON48050.1 putative Positive regulator of sigma(E),RseC/MucC [Vibrio tapetis subsp. tapetis]
MMTALATVASVESTEHGFRAELSCEQQTSCSHCSSQKSCGTGIVSKAVGNKSHTWWLETSDKVESGQVVEIGLPEKQLLQSAAVVYLFPLFFLMLGAAVGQFWLAPMLGGGEGSIILLSFAFAVLGFMLARYWTQRNEHQSVEKVTLIRIMGQPLKGIATFDDSGNA